jgi:hypothetical protein
VKKRRCDICKRKGKQRKMYVSETYSHGRPGKRRWLHGRCIEQWNKIADEFEQEWGQAHA